ncbi:MAG TPA: rhomboid family intramembrane serine protease [Phycisphaerae bacterium]|nr:rhomboid family intramembrane serine protease [Phycisphaerae bacterium]
MFFLLPYLVDVPMHRWPLANWLLILVTIIVSIAMFPALGQWEYARFLGVQPAPGVVNYFLLDPEHFQLSQLIGSAFIHGGYWHLFGNMFFLWLFGNAVNARLGHWKFLAIYFCAAVFSAIFYLLFGPKMPMLGASGAIMGIMGAFLILYPRNNVSCIWCFFFRFGTTEFSCYWLLALYFVLNILGLIDSNDHVAHISHIAGFVFGVAVTSLLVWLNWIEQTESEENLLELLSLKKKSQET